MNNTKLDSVKNRYYLFTIIVAVISLVGFIQESTTLAERLKSILILNIGPHLLYLALYFGVKLQLSIMKGSLIFSTYKKMLVPFSWLFVILGIIIVPINVINAIQSEDLLKLGVCSMGLALALAGYNLNQHLKTLQ